MRPTAVAKVGRLGRSAVIALGASVAACGGPSCPKEEPRPTPMEVVTLPDGGTELQPMPIAIYGTSPPPCR